MSRRRWGAIAGVSLAVLVAAIGVERSISRGNDFDNFYDAGVSVYREGELLSEKATRRYPPTFQVFMAPFGAFPLEIAAFLWLVLNYAAFTSLPWAFARLSGTPPLRQRWAWFAVLPFLISNVTLGQSGPLLLALVTVGVLFTGRERPVLGGAAITWAGLLKVFPGALLAVPIVLGRARGALLGALLATAIAIGWVSLAIGPSAGAADLSRWLREVRTEQTPQQMIETKRSLRYNNQGLAITLVRSLADFDPRRKMAAKGSVEVASLPVPVAFGIYYAIVASLLGVLAACVWRVRHVPTPRVFLGLYALAVPAMLALSPIVWTHYFIWLLPAFVYLADRTRLLQVLGVASLVAIYSVPARALGFHMGMTLLLFGLVALQLWRETSPAPEPEVAPTPAQ